MRGASKRIAELRSVEKKRVLARDYPVCQRRRWPSLAETRAGGSAVRLA